MAGDGGLKTVERWMLLAFSALPELSKTWKKWLWIWHAGASLLRKLWYTENKMRKKLLIQEAEFNNCLINKIQQGQEKRGKPITHYYTVLDRWSPSALPQTMPVVSIWQSGTFKRKLSSHQWEADTLYLRAKFSPWSLTSSEDTDRGKGSYIPRELIKRVRQGI